METKLEHEQPPPTKLGIWYRSRVVRRQWTEEMHYERRDMDFSTTAEPTSKSEAKKIRDKALAAKQASLLVHHMQASGAAIQPLKASEAEVHRYRIRRLLL